jgi:diguanylate cyclase (GGDEF)-like protein
MEKFTRILLIEDSKFFSQLVKKAILERIDAEIVTVTSLAETKAAVEAANKPFHLALSDIVLPDSHDGESIDYLKEKGIPAIVFTGVFSEAMRERLLAHSIIDYVVKDTPASLNYLVNLVERLHKNQDVTVLLVDDSRAARLYMGDLLRAYRFNVLEAGNGKEALKVLGENPHIRMVITDYNMPVMDGVEMVKRMRGSHDADQLAIIALSSGGTGALSAQFIKCGANDFITKPFLREEFFCRIIQNIRMLDMVDRLKDMATKDPLTRIHNRRFFFEAGEGLFSSAKRDHLSLTAAMMDIDFFKKVNDTYGHDGGDAVLKRVASLLRELCRQTDIVARLGGEEFAILAVNMDEAHVRPFFDKLRIAISEAEIIHNGKRIPVAASFGVCHGVGTSLDSMLKSADEALYRAKEGGRNRVEIC